MEMFIKCIDLAKKMRFLKNVFFIYINWRFTPLGLLLASNFSFTFNSVCFFKNTIESCHISLSNPLMAAHFLLT